MSFRGGAWEVPKMGFGWVKRGKNPYKTRIKFLTSIWGSSIPAKTPLKTLNIDTHFKNPEYSHSIFADFWSFLALFWSFLPPFYRFRGPPPGKVVLRTNLSGNFA
jgi:hypothetical protein